MATQFIQEFNEYFHYSRRLLLISAATVQQYHPETTMAPPLAAGINHDTFDANVIMVLAILVCAVICSLVLNSIIKNLFSCSTLVLVESSSNNPSSSKLANRGIKKKALKTFPVITYTTEFKHSWVDSECVICLSKFGVGEKVKILPKCNHGFHIKCIDKWLNSHSSCPTCRHCLIETCQNIIDGNQAPVPEIIVRIELPQHEDIIYNNQH
ncbi:hypothetical protein RND71_022027 [Anisodus tanguticus]|uniref:RING-type E3 ubiquitin transferase n=1 Tax=Anisodus tanguticus TaxID=243964 RepID=A0AAE1V7U8_9SOLA|nr:hypothetical protein RND71_022027 [Anisodus tanguticus]